MKLTTSRRTAAAIVAVAAIGVGLFGATPAMAATTAPTSPDTVSVSTPMVFAGYDADVAAANGYKIVTAADGTQSSVAVTAQAKATVQPNATVPGNCGTSFLNGAKLSNDQLAIQTGYKVPFTVADKTWRVPATSFFSAHTFSWDGPSGGAWTVSAAATLVGPGVAAVSTASFVIGTNGRVCHSGGPSISFG